jgi:Brp/Blh family beta-carotene 15,15'-monooxygenase
VGGAEVRKHALLVLSSYDTHFINAQMHGEPVPNPEGYTILTETGHVSASRVYDSRPPVFAAPEKHQAHLLQSFIGWMVETSTACFDPSKMILMDFNVPQLGSTQFVYVLPFSKHTALIELTRFGRTRLSEEEALPLLQEYVSAINRNYTIVSTEKGAIPMSTCKMEVPHHGPEWIHTGTRAGLLKPTTGYAFHVMAEDALIQADKFQHHRTDERLRSPARFAFYDRLLLKILDEQPDKGRPVFQALFRHTSISNVLHFLREKTRPIDEIRIFARLPIPLFLHAALKEALYILSKLPTAVYGLMLTGLFLCLSLLQLDILSWTVLGVGFLVVGLTHGALDHLTDARITNKSTLIRFVFTYLLKGALLGLVWMLLPVLALTLFIVYSAWHFGQADYREWRKVQDWKSITWGLGILLSILLLHFSETLLVLDQIPGVNASRFFALVSPGAITLTTFITIGLTLLLALRERSLFMLMTLAYVVASGLLPLLISFGIYFVAQHSMNGWRHLISGLEQDFKPLFIKSLPFTAGAAFIILLFMLSGTSDYTGIFFILLSCLSIPHVFSMHHFYRRIARG